MNKFAKNQVFPCSKHVYIIILLSEGMNDETTAAVTYVFFLSQPCIDLLLHHSPFAVPRHMRFADASLFYHSLLSTSKAADQKIKNCKNALRQHNHAVAEVLHAEHTVCCDIFAAVDV